MSGNDPTGELRIAVVGASGRTGRLVGAACQAAPDLRLVAALVSAESANLGRDAGEVAGIGTTGLPLEASLRTEADVLVDFSAPDACVRWAGIAAERGIAFVSGTTGLGSDQDPRLGEAAEHIALVQAANMSLGVNLLLRLVHEAAEVLGTDHDVSVLDVHHRHKHDVPSGTALALARLLAETRGREPSVHSLRIGGRPGDHTVYFASEHETLTLSHAAHDRMLFAQGALAAARWVHGRAPGRYTMQDVLFGSR